MNDIERVKEAKRKVTRQRDNWKARAIALEKELNEYKEWHVKLVDWHNERTKAARMMLDKYCGSRK